MANANPTPDAANGTLSPLRPLAKCLSAAPTPPRPSEAALAMLGLIAQICHEDGRCHSRSVVASEHDADLLASLERAGLLDTDLCDCRSCRQDEHPGTCEMISDEGLAVLGAKECPECHRPHFRDAVTCDDECAQRRADDLWIAKWEAVAEGAGR